MHTNGFAALAESPITIQESTCPGQHAYPHAPFGPIHLNGTPPFHQAAGSPFQLGGEGITLSNDSLAPINAHQQLLRAEAVKHGIPDRITEAFVGDCPPIDLFVCSFFWAGSAVERCITMNQAPDLSQQPMAKKMAEMLWQMHLSNKAAEETVVTVETPPNSHNADGTPSA